MDNLRHDLKDNGFAFLRGYVESEWIKKLTDAMNVSFEVHRRLQSDLGSEIKTEGVALYALLTSEVYIDFLSYILEKGFFDLLSREFFDAPCILNSFSALNNIPNAPNFASKIHRDLRFYSGSFPVMLNCLLMVDDFTENNGATYILPKSHLIKDSPSAEEFFLKCIQTTGQSGDILVFNSNMWHAAAPNKSTFGRRAIPFTVSRSFLKQLVDYPRALGYERMKDFSSNLQQILGYHSRVPANLEEWYMPHDLRFYKKNQD